MRARTVAGVLFCSLCLLCAACGAMSPYEVVEFWQRLDNVPGREADPYAGRSDCSLIAEDLHVFGPIGSREHWVERQYVCDGGAP